MHLQCLTVASVARNRSGAHAPPSYAVVTPSPVPMETLAISIISIFAAQSLGRARGRLPAGIDQWHRAETFGPIMNQMLSDGETSQSDLIRLLAWGRAACVGNSFRLRGQVLGFSAEFYFFSASCLSP